MVRTAVLSVMVMARVLCCLDCWWLVVPMVWMLAGPVLGAGRWVARMWSLVSVGWLPVLV